MRVGCVKRYGLTVMRCVLLCPLMFFTCSPTSHDVLKLIGKCDQTSGSNMTHATGGFLSPRTSTTTHTGSPSLCCIEIRLNKRTCAVVSPGVVRRAIVVDAPISQVTNHFTMKPHHRALFLRCSLHHRALASRWRILHLD